MGNGFRVCPRQTEFGGKRQIPRCSVCAECPQRDFGREIARVNGRSLVNRCPARTGCFTDSNAERDSASGLCCRQAVPIRIGRRGAASPMPDIAFRPETETLMGKVEWLVIGMSGAVNGVLLFGSIA